MPKNPTHLLKNFKWVEKIAFLGLVDAVFCCIMLCVVVSYFRAKVLSVFAAAWLRTASLD